MTRRKVEIMRADHRGFTLVELLISIAILAIVIVSVCSFILVGSRSYASANSDISVQQEAQLALNQMSDVLIDTTRSVNYAGYDASGSATLVLKDSEFAFEPEAKSLIMYNGVPVETVSPGGTSTTEIEEGNGNKHYQFYWDKNDETLYYAELDVDKTDVKPEDITFPPFGDPGWVVLAEHVTKFEVDLTQVEEKRVVQLELTFVNGQREYNTSNNVTIRNKVGVNDAEIGPLDRSKTLSVISKDSGVILEPGETYHFSTPKVSGKNVTDKSVVWSMAPGYSGTSIFTDSANGILKVGDNEPAGTLEVVITTNAVDSDGNHASTTVVVYIKRVTNVSLSKTNDENPDNTADTVTIGKKFTVLSSVEGPYVGVLCSGCGEDVSTDKDVINWTVEGPATMNDSNAKEAQFTVNTTAKEGDVITIRATSYLSTRRTYPDVIGELKLTVKKGKSGDMTLDGAIRWGKKVGFSGKYPDDFNKGGQGYYLICARIKEDLGAPASQDKIMMYTSHGNNSALTPDLFGVEDISKPWYVSLQVLDPGQHFQSGVGPSEQLLSDLQSQISDPRITNVINDYLANCDSEGNYIGTYPHSDKMTGIIQPPQIYYAYDGKENLGGQLNLNPVYVARGYGWDTQFSVHYVKNTRGEVDGGDYNARYVKFKVYREGSDGSWGEPIFQYVQEDRHSHDLSAGGSWHGTQDDGHINFDITSATNAYIKLNQNNNPLEAVGKYHIVPIIKYVQDPGADSSYSVYYANYQPNYWNVQTYDVPESTIHYEVRGGNLELWSYAYGKFAKGEIYFPTPSSNDFTAYFDRNESSWQDSKKINDFNVLVEGGSNSTYQSSGMRCRYVSSLKAYELELFYNYRDSVWNRDVEVSAGVFKCTEDGSRWERVKAGTYDSYLESGRQIQIEGSTADVNFSMWGQSYNGKMYIPLPSEKGFTSDLGFQLKKTDVQTKEWYSFKYQPAGQSGTNDVQMNKVTCVYDQTTDKYTLEFFVYDWGSQTDIAVTKFECTSNGTRWTQKN